MLESLVIGSSATGIMVYLMSKVRCYFSQGSTCSNPLFIDSNENELTTVSNRNDTEVLVNKQKTKRVFMFFNLVS